jgi:hypothetical protein
MNNFTGPDFEKPSDSDAFSQSLKHLSCEEFDGHTEFFRLSPEDKLKWLSEIARFFYDHHSKRITDE